MSGIPLKEATVVVVDVGCTNVATGPATRAMYQLLQQKMMFSPRDEVALVLLGTTDTHNKLAMHSPGQYKHITVVRPFMCPDVKLLESIQALTPQTGPGDMLDSLVVAADLIHDKTEGKRFRKKVFLVTPAARKEKRKDDLQVIMDALKSKEITVVVVGIDFTETVESSSEEGDWGKLSEKQQNERVLYYVCDYVGNGSVVIAAGEALDTLSQLRAKTIPQRPYCSCVLDIGNTIKIPIKMFVKSLPQRVPALKSRSTKLKGSLSEVAMQRTYFTVSGDGKEVDRAETVRAYRYGRSVVPVNEFDEDKIKAHTCGVKSMSILAFFPESELPRHYMYGNVFAVSHFTGDKCSREGFTALVHGMMHLGRCALVRFIWRNGTNPTIGCLVPVVKANYTIMYYCALPFAEDIRNYTFRTLSDVDVAPSEQKQMDDFVQALTVDDFEIKQVHNPVLQFYYQCLRTRASEPTSELPPMDPAIKAKCCSWGDEDNILHNVAVKTAQLGPVLAASFPVSLSSDTDGGGPEKRKKYWFARGDAVSVEDVGNERGAKKVKLHGGGFAASGGGLSGGTGTTNSVPPFSTTLPASGGIGGGAIESGGGGVETVGTTHPVDDFTAMVKRRDRNLVPDAIAQMQEVVFTLLKHSIGGDLHTKCFHCVGALRRVCISERVGDEFNGFLRHLKGTPSAEAFVKNHVVPGGIIPVHEDEHPGIGLSRKDAENFFRVEVHKSEEVLFDDVVSGDEEDLFDQLE